jgi:phosphomannomutase/phosphoglucomutase
MGGEMSGHYYFNDPDIDFDDGTFTSAVLTNALAAQPASLSSLVAQLPRYPATPELTVACPDDRKFQVVDRLRDMFAQDHEVITIDGARVLFDKGWGVVRASNTEPRLTLRFEAETEADLEDIKAQFRQALVEVGLVPSF